MFINLRIEIIQLINYCKYLILYNNMFEIFCINLKNRNDRMKNIYNIFNNQKYFKINRFNAIRNQNGALGCLSSHLKIIKENINRPYVIVMEDDLILNDTITNIYNIINLLIINISKWTIFNGTPTFYSFKKNKNIVNSKIENTPFINLNWGQSTSFMIYSNKCYDKLIKLLEIQEKNFVKPIDILISENFIQTTYFYGYLFYQKEDWSDIEKRNNANIKYLDYQKNEEKKLIIDIENLIINKRIYYKIGIFTIFIGDYTIFYDKFIESINQNFFPGIKKKIFIITNKDLKSYKNTFILKISSKFINFPFPTLFRFKYFNKIPDSEYKNIDYMFFINSNALILRKIYLYNLPITKYRFLFVLHNGYYNSKYYSIPYEKNKISTAFVPYLKDYKYNYVGGRFYGASLLDFKKMCNKLYNNILEDLNNNYIAIWHDESHINRFLFKNKLNNYFLAGINYHIPEEDKKNKHSQNKMIIYLDKRKKIKSYPKSWKEKNIKYINNGENEITDELINFYKN